MTAPSREPTAGERVREMDAKATKAPWEQRPDTYAGSVWVTRTHARGTRMVETCMNVLGEVLRFHRDEGQWPEFDKAKDYPQHERDAAVTCALRNSLPALAALLDAAEALRDCADVAVLYGDEHAPARAAYDAALAAFNAKLRGK